MTGAKYFKPLSLTWWASVAPLVAGLFIAADPLHGWEAMTITLRDITGGVDPYVLINSGLVGIGLRGALP